MTSERQDTEARVSAALHHAYDVSADGQRFVMIRINEAGQVSDALIVVENWFDELGARVGR